MRVYLNVTKGKILFHIFHIETKRNPKLDHSEVRFSYGHRPIH